MRRLKKEPGFGRKFGRTGDHEYTYLDRSVLKQNNITRLTIDERWTRLFSSLPMSPAIERMQNELNELIKKEALLKQEQESLEPTKKKIMNRIIYLTRDAFEENDAEAKTELKRCSREIERINDRMDKILEDIERISDELREANMTLLNETVHYIFSTLKNNKERAEAIIKELELIREKEKALKEELESINLDWTSLAVDLTELIGAEHVKRLESQFGLEGLKKDEAVNSGSDEGN